jgi:hypothetical protein
MALRLQGIANQGTLSIGSLSRFIVNSIFCDCRWRQLSTSEWYLWLDKRNARLVKLAEDPLKKLELRLADRTDLSSMKILCAADIKVGGRVWSMLETFRQIFRLVFLLAGLVGVGILGLSVRQLLW